ncbi:MAG TPA: glycosyltransferase family 2 protein [Christiangramia sp.]|nr:glycosyltransferase family 2 protein [Christiangramia sp.]
MHYEETIKPIESADQPLVSIITPLFNAEKFISETIGSVMDQSYSNWEHIIVDDASNDASVMVAQRSFNGDSRFKLVQLENNHGAAYCRNHATEQANGEYIAFLDSDDLWHPQKLEQQIQIMEEGHLSVTFTSYLHIDEHGNALNKRIKALPILSYAKQHRNNYICNITGIYRAGKLGKIFAPNIRKRQDWAVWLEAIKRNESPAVGIQKDLAFYRVRQDSISSDKINLLQYNFRFYSEYFRYSWLKSFFCLTRFLIEYFLVRPKQIEYYK